MEQPIATYREFYKFYLSEHQDKTCRLLHVIGTTFVIAMLFMSIYKLDYRIFLLIPVVGYGFAWVGHFVFEKNKPATFKYPLWSLKSDFKMYFDILAGRLSIDSSKKDANYNY